MRERNDIHGDEDWIEADIKARAKQADPDDEMEWRRYEGELEAEYSAQIKGAIAQAAQPPKPEDTYLIETYERDHLGLLEFPNVTADEEHAA